jgi:hypothetical protein
MARLGPISLFRPELRPLAITGGQGRAAGALGALAVGASALAAVAIGRLAIRRAAIQRLEIEELEVGRLRVRELQIERGGAAGIANGPGGEQPLSAPEPPLGPPD